MTLDGTRLTQRRSALELVRIHAACIKLDKCSQYPPYDLASSSFPTSIPKKPHVGCDAQSRYGVMISLLLYDHP
jgi:hypothetical protein